MLIRLNVDQLRVVGLWGLGLADMGPGRHGDGPKWVRTQNGSGRNGSGQNGSSRRGKMPATQSRKFENKSNKTRI